MSEWVQSTKNLHEHQTKLMSIDLRWHDHLLRRPKDKEKVRMKKKNEKRKEQIWLDG